MPQGKIAVALVFFLVSHAILRSHIEEEDVIASHPLENPFDVNQIRVMNNKDPARKFRLSVDPHFLPYLALNYDLAVADFIWLRFIQGMDQPVIDIKNKGWLYQMLKGVITLDERFRMAYKAGGIWLTAIRRDTEGATDILTLGTLQYPNDWSLHLQLLYHHLWETRDDEKAREVAEKTSKIEGAPVFLKTLVSQFMSREGKYDAAIAYLKNQMDQTEKEWEKKAFLERLKMLVVERDSHQLQNLISKHYKTWPTSWDTLVQNGHLKGIPRDPAKDIYLIDPKERRVYSKTIEIKSGLDKRSED